MVKQESNKILVIVESPSKITKIQQILNQLFENKYEFIVKASYGHVRDLDSKKLSINIEKDFEPIYIKGQNKDRVISELRFANKQCKEVWLASDCDREGESIAWHLSELLDLKKERRKRIIFSEITKAALKKASENPKDIDMNMFYAQQARRVIDRLIGYLISPILWKQIQNSTKKSVSLSAGRVQSVVMRLIIEREQQIQKFESSGFYKTIGQFTFNKSKNDVKILNTDLNENLKDKVIAKEFLTNCIDSEFVVSDVNIKKSTRKPSAPFITSTLQQEASTKLRMSPKNTMSSAQKLFEAGYITYMRTDSVELSKEAIDMITEHINNNYGEDYLNVKQYKGKSKNSQEAHEAIRPCKIKITNVSDDQSMTNYEDRLYRLIWKRTVASQMSSAKVEICTTKISVSKSSDYYFTTKSEKILFDGFLKVYKPTNDNEDDDENIEDKEFIKLKKGDILTRKSIVSSERFSKPPHGRFTEASLVKKLDEMGIGRPSTYSSMISVVQDRNYANKKDKEGVDKDVNIYKLNGSNTIEKQKDKIKIGGEKQKLFPSPIGFIVNEFLLKHFSNILDYKFTANLENQLDNVSGGEIQWNKIVKDIYDMFHPKLLELGHSDNLEKDKFKRVLGNDPDTGYPIQTYIAKYGPVVQLTRPDNKHKFAPLKDVDMKDVTLEQALKLLKYPYEICQYKSKKVEVCKGKYGVYLKYNGKNFSIGETIEESLKDEAVIKQIIDGVQQSKEGSNSDNQSGSQYKSNVIKKFDDKVSIKNGKYGAYVCYKDGKLNVKIYGNKKPEELTLEDCIQMINKKKQKK